MLLLLALVVAACGSGAGGKSGATEGAGSIEASATTSQAANSSATSGTNGASTPAQQSAATPAKSPVPAPTPTSAQVADFTNGLLGDGQQPLFWMQILTGDRDCGSVCDRSYAVRWQTLSNLCKNGRWEARRAEDGYSAKVHGEAITALVDSCNIIAAHLANDGTPIDNETWRGFANDALNRLWPVLDTLAETGSRS
jgi:hypothetical protein